MIYKMLKKVKFEGNWVNLRQKIGLLQTILDKIFGKKNKKIQLDWTDYEKFDIYFCVFLDCYCQIYFLEGRLDNQMPTTKFEVFLIFPYFQWS